MKTNFKSLSTGVKWTSFLSILLLFSSCQDEMDIKDTMAETKSFNLSKDEINQFVSNTIAESDDSFNWNEAPENIVWSALQQSQFVAMIGYKNQVWTKQEIGDFIYKINSNSDKLSKEVDLVKQNIKNIITDNNKLSKNIISEDDQMLSMTVTIKDIETLRALRNNDNIRYIEVMYDPNNSNDLAAKALQIPDDFGCGSYASNYFLIRDVDYGILSNSFIGWNFRYHNIKETWDYGGAGNTGKGTGKGIGVAILDTGLADVNTMNPNTSTAPYVDGFNNGVINGRTRGFYDFVWRSTTIRDFCGHGTALAGVIAGPRGGGFQNAIGVAYGSNLLALKVGNDVLINGQTDIDNVSAGYRYAADQSSVRIITMSGGTIFYSQKIADAITYAFERGKLMFAASGTVAMGAWLSTNLPASASNSVFPCNVANYRDGQDMVYGVTGINTGYGACDACVYGSKVDFAIVMEKNSTNGGGKKQSLALSRSANFPTTIGGSSAATATMAGIAAVVWGKNPTKTRASVISALKSTSDYPSRNNSSFGHGKPNTLNAYKAL